MMESNAIHFRTTLDPRSRVRSLTPGAIHGARQQARRTLVRLRALRPVFGRTAFAGLRQSLRDLIAITSESRDAEVQRGMVLRLTADLPKRDARECHELLVELKSRKQAATAGLAAYLRSETGSEVLRRQNKDLMELRRTQSTADLPRLAARRHRRELHNIDELLAHRIPTGRRVHSLRIRMRRAQDLASLFYAPLGVGAKHLNHELNRMQEALGDLHDARLFARWANEHGLTITAPLTAAMDVQAKGGLKRCRRNRKRLRHSLHRFLKKTRQ
jgi:CHAD domain-containing protein